MLRKCFTIGAVMTALTVTFAAFSWADDDESPLHKLMEGVNKKNAVVNGALKSATTYKKGHKKAADASEELVKAAKASKKDTSAVTKQKKTVAEWNKLSDDFIKATTELSEVLAKDDATLDAAKQAHKTVKASCTSCHDVFRIEDK